MSVASAGWMWPPRERREVGDHKTILYIGVDSAAAAYVAAGLRMLGYNVFTADETSAAHDQRAPQPDLIVVDVRVLEKLLGPEVTAAGRRVPLVLLAARTPGNADRAGETPGLDVSVVKPRDIADLDHLLANRLASTRAHQSPVRSDLTEREIEALSWAARGMNSDQIAERLGLTSRTVDFHVERARKKLGAATRINAVARALAAGLIEL